jgi:transposase
MRRKRRHPSDLTIAQWRHIAGLPPPRPGGRPDKHSHRAIIGAILYIVRTGCSWRQLDFPPVKRSTAGRPTSVRCVLADVGLLLAQHAIRALLVGPASYDPGRVSFTQGVRVVHRQVTDQAAVTP